MACGFCNGVRNGIRIVGKRILPTRFAYVKPGSQRQEQVVSPGHITRRKEPKFK